ncbi:MAG: hypothetical protein KA164_02210, partial [Rhodoferax sp.]|nr:hypothetical protein [Rhodoferax sp.]
MRRVLMRVVRQPAAAALLALGCGAGALAQQPAPREATAHDEAPGESVELRRAQTEPLRYPLPAIDPNQVPEPGRLVPRTSLPVP